MDKKTRHEDFVSFLTGGNVAEIYAVSAICVLGIATHSFVAQNLEPGTPASYIADFIFNWGTVLAVTTIYANNLLSLAAALGATALIAAFASATSKHSQSLTAVNGNSKPASDSSPKQKPALKSKAAAKRTPGGRADQENSAIAYRPFLTVYRSAMMVLTVTCILAVDFVAYPRRFAKTETWGTSLMDLGVGSFVLSMGLVSARRSLKQPDLAFKTEIGQSIMQAFKVLVLGFVRLGAVKLLDYQEHVTEYGVHWNFFFTLGLLPTAFVFVRRIPWPKSTLVKAILIAVGYEIALKNTGLMEWVLAAPRTSLISENKEGISSFVGYLSIFSFGYALGMLLLSSATSLRTIIVSSAKWTIAAHVAFWILTSATQPSRRMANLPYVIWVVAFNSGFLGLLALLQWGFDVSPSSSYTAVNTYGETIFLLSNLGTGIVNLSVDTLSLDRPAIVAVLTGYQATLMLAAQFLFTLRR